MRTRTFVRVDDGQNGNPRFTTNEHAPGYLGGYYVATDGEASAEEIARMKETVVEEVCNEIRKIANERDDFFIVKTGVKMPGRDDVVTTVGAKFLLPTVKDNT